MTGRGQWVKTSILECALAWLSMHIVTLLLGGEEPAPLGTRSPFFAPYEAYRTADGYLVVVGTGGTDSWGDLCRSLGLEHYDEGEITAKLETAGFTVQRSRSNIGHNAKRMTFLAHAR